MVNFGTPDIFSAQFSGDEQGHPQWASIDWAFSSPGQSETLDPILVSRELEAKRATVCRLERAVERDK